MKLFETKRLCRRTDGSGADDERTDLATMTVTPTDS